MVRTRHMHQRMGQCGVTSRLVDLTSHTALAMATALCWISTTSKSYWPV